MSFDDLAADISTQTAPFVFGIPGGGPSLTLLDALLRQGYFGLTTRFEGAAAIMAATIGRLSGKPGVALSIKGPGLANMVPGLALARLDAFPVFAIAEAYKPDTPIGRSHKRMEHHKLVDGVTKAHRFWSERGPSASHLALVSQAEVPGPVLFEIAEGPIAEDDALSDEASENMPASLENLSKVLALILRSEMPIVIAGSFAVRQGWHEALANLKIPVFSSVAAKGVIDEQLPYAGGVYTGVGLELTPERAVLAKADLIVGVGVRSNEMLKSGFDIPAINIDDVVSAAPGFVFEAITDAGSFALVMDALMDRSWGADIIAAARRKLNHYMMQGAYLPAKLFHLINEEFIGEARVVLDTGYFCTIGEHACISRRPDLFLGSFQGRDMGVGLPMAIAASLYDRSRPTVLATGDGGIGMYVGELKAAVEHNLPLLVVLMTNGGFGSILPRALAAGLITAPLIMKQPSWASALGGMGFSVAKANTAQEFSSAIATWDRSSPLFVEAYFDDVPYRAMVAGIRQ